MDGCLLDWILTMTGPRAVCAISWNVSVKGRRLARVSSFVTSIATPLSSFQYGRVSLACLRESVPLILGTLPVFFEQLLR